MQSYILQQTIFVCKCGYEYTIMTDFNINTLKPKKCKNCGSHDLQIKTNSS